MLAFPMIRMHGVVSVHDYPLFPPGAGSFEIFALVSSFVQRLTNDVSRMESHLGRRANMGLASFNSPRLHAMAVDPVHDHEPAPPRNRRN